MGPASETHPEQSDAGPQCAASCHTHAGVHRQSKPVATAPPFLRCPAGWSGSPRSGPAAGGLRGEEGREHMAQGCRLPTATASLRRRRCSKPNPSLQPPHISRLRSALTAGGGGVKVAHILAQHRGQVPVPHVVHLPHACSSVVGGAADGTVACSCQTAPRPASERCVS